MAALGALAGLPAAPIETGEPGLGRRRVLPAGTTIIWTQRGLSRRGRIVALILAGTPPGQVVPEILELNRWRVHFRDPSLARVRDHYLVSKVEARPRLGEILVYYLPDAEHVMTVRSRP